MAKLALIFLAIAVAAGVLGFVVDVAGAIAKMLFFVFLAAAVLSFLGKSLMDRKRGGSA